MFGNGASVSWDTRAGAAEVTPVFESRASNKPLHNRVKKSWIWNMFPATFSAVWKHMDQNPHVQFNLNAFLTILWKNMNEHSFGAWIQKNDRKLIKNTQRWYLNFSYLVKVTRIFTQLVQFSVLCGFWKFSFFYCFHMYSSWFILKACRGTPEQLEVVPGIIQPSDMNGMIKDLADWNYSSHTEVT